MGRLDILITIPDVPELGVIDLFSPSLSQGERLEVLAGLSAIHLTHFPTYGHILEDLRAQLATGLAPAGEVVHAWLVIRDEKPVGEWIFNVNKENGIILMLFGAVDRDARIDLPREWLPKLVDFLLDICVEEAHRADRVIKAGILESADEHISRWRSCGFVVADSDYEEPINGVHWQEEGELEFYDSYAACVRAIDSGIGMPQTELAMTAIRTLLVDHYLLPEDHECVIGSLGRAAKFIEYV